MIYSIASSPSYITNSIISLFLSGFSLIAIQIAKKQGLINKYIYQAFLFVNMINILLVLYQYVIMFFLRPLGIINI